jgi:transcriptional regulator with XRE-family HTH domain
MFIFLSISDRCIVLLVFLSPKTTKVKQMKKDNDKKKSDTVGLFKERIYKLRQEKEVKEKISKAEIAKEIGINVATLGYYENGDRCPDIVTLKKIADFYNVSCDYLLGLTEASNQNQDIQELAKKTNINDKTIEVLQWISEEPSIVFFQDGAADILNMLISGNESNFISVIEILLDYKESYKDIYTDYIEKKTDNEANAIELSFSKMLLKEEVELYEHRITKTISHIVDSVVKQIKHEVEQSVENKDKPNKHKLCKEAQFEYGVIDCIRSYRKEMMELAREGKLIEAIKREMKKPMEEENFAAVATILLSTGLSNQKEILQDGEVEKIASEIAKRPRSKHSSTKRKKED